MAQQGGDHWFDEADRIVRIPTGRLNGSSVAAGGCDTGLSLGPLGANTVYDFMAQPDAYVKVFPLEGGYGWAAEYRPEAPVAWMVTPKNATAIEVMTIITTRHPDIEWKAAPKHANQREFFGRIRTRLPRRCQYHDDRGRQCVYHGEHQKYSGTVECSFA